jgi:hypothetical protein
MPFRSIVTTNRPQLRALGDRDQAMEISFSLFGASGKRWHSKVVRQASLSLSNKMAGFDSVNTPEMLSAEFDDSESNKVRVVETVSIEGIVTTVSIEGIVTTIRFATKNWETLSESIPLCESQLIGAIVEILVRGRVQSQKLPYDFSKSHVVIYSKSYTPDDGVKNIYWYINQEMDSKNFLSLVDELDSRLLNAKAGEVSGNSFSLSKIGSCIDVASKDSEKALSTIEKIAEERNINDFELGE